MADSDIIVSLHLVIPFISMGCSKQDSKLAITKHLLYDSTTKIQAKAYYIGQRRF